MGYQNLNALGQSWLTDPWLIDAESKAIGALTSTQQAAIRAVVSDFPKRLLQAKRDYYVYKAGLKAGLFPWSTNTKRVRQWFAEFPRLWQAIRPNYELPTTAGGMIIAHQAAILTDADAFVKELGADPEIRNNLGMAPLLVAGVFVAAIAGLAGIVWAIGYVKDQNNISKIIDGVTAGKLPISVLQAAQDQASSPGLFDNIADVVKWGAIGLAVFLIAPPVINALTSRKPANA